MVTKDYMCFFFFFVFFCKDISAIPRTSRAIDAECSSFIFIYIEGPSNSSKDNLSFVRKSFPLFGHSPVKRVLFNWKENTLANSGPWHRHRNIIIEFIKRCMSAPCVTKCRKSDHWGHRDGCEGGKSGLNNEISYTGRVQSCLWWWVNPRAPTSLAVRNVDSGGGGQCNSRRD